MTFDEYTKAAMRTAFIDSPDYLALGLNGEAGEVAEIIKKKIRAKRDRIGWTSEDWTDEERLDLAEEISDCLWYMAVMSEKLGFSLEEIAIINEKKLKERYSKTC